MFYIFPLSGCGRCNPGSKKKQRCLLVNVMTHFKFCLDSCNEFGHVCFIMKCNAMQWPFEKRRQNSLWTCVLHIECIFHKCVLRQTLLGTLPSKTYVMDLSFRFQRSTVSTFSTQAKSFSSCSISQNGALGSNWTFLLFSIWFVVVVVTFSSPEQIHFDVAVVV